MIGRGRQAAGGGQPGDPPVEHAQEAADPLQVLVVEDAQEVPDLAGVEVAEAVDQLEAGRRQAHEDPPAVRPGRRGGRPARAPRAGPRCRSRSAASRPGGPPAPTC